MANTVSVSAVPFNPNTQSFQTTSSAPQSTAVTNVNTNKGVPTAAENLAAFNASQANTTSTFKAPTSSNVPVSSLGTSAIKIPTQQTQTSSFTTSNYPQSYLTAQQQQDQQIVDTSNNIATTQANLYSLLSGQATETANAKNSADILAKKQQFQDLSNQVLQRTAELNQDDVSLAAGLQNIQDQAIPMQFITGQQQSVQNQANLARAVKISNINMLNAVAQSVQGNIALAQQTAQDAVDAKYAPVKEQISILQAQQAAIQPLLTQAEKRISDQQAAQLDIQKQLITNKQTNDKTFLEMVMKAPTDYGATPQMVSSAIDTYNKTGDVFQATQALAGYGGSQINSAYNTSNNVRNTTYNTTGQITIDNGYSLDLFKKGIAGVESSNNYNAIGPATKSGDKAYGKYQVMGANIPSWTQQALGYSMTPQQFLNSPQAQEAVFENQSTTNYAKYGNWDDVASVWFSGKPLTGNNASDGYNTVPAYVAKVRTAMGVPAQPTTLSQVTDPSVKYWSDYLKANPTKSIKEVPLYLQTQVVAYNNQNVVNDPQTQAVVEKINQIDNILNSSALSSVVGPNIFSRGSGGTGGVFGKFLTGAAVGGGVGAAVGAPVFGVGAIVTAPVGAVIGGTTAAVAGNYASLSGQAQNFIGDVEQLSNQQFIDKLIAAKAQGATFGALNEQEGAALRNASSKLNNWAIKSGGQTVGYNIDEQSFINELNTIKRLAQKGIANSGGNILGGTVGQTYAQSIIQATNTSTTVNTLNYGFQ